MLAHVRLHEWLMATAAWASLDCVARSLYVEIARRYRGPNSNNGRIPYSVREAAKALTVGRSTAQRAFEKLLDRGFVRVGKNSGFNMKGRASTEWRLTEYADDTKQGELPTKEFTRWQPTSAFHSPMSDRHSPVSEPPMALRRDRVA